MACVVCGFNLNRLGTRQGYTYTWCPACGSVQLQDIPTQNELNRLYEAEYHNSGHYYSSLDQHQKDRQRVCAHIADVVAALHPRGDTRHIVELGAGWGNLGLEFQNRQIPYLGVEPSEEMCARAQQRGLTMIQGSLDALCAMEPLPTIRAFVLMAVYEHLPDQEDMLARMKAMLPEDGVIVLQCPTAGIPRVVGRALHRIAPQRELPSLFGSLAPPWHICLPSPHGVRLQALRCGLTVESVTPSPSGRRSDWRKTLQIANELISEAGFRLVGEGWPLSMAHVFVLRLAQ